MIELPKGVWQWINQSGRDIARIAAALERLADEATRIRRLSEADSDEKEECE